MTASLNESEPDVAISDEALMQMLFQLIEEDEEMANAIFVQRVLPWDCIAPTEEIAEHFYIIIDGLVQILITSKENRRLVTSVLGPGAIFGEETIFQFAGQGPNYCAQAIKPSIVWELPAARAREFLIKHSVLRLALLRSFGLRLVQVENRLEETAYRWLPERLAAELIRQTRYAESNQIRLSHQALADILGTYRETISAILRDFREVGWVKLGYRRIIILDPEALKNMTGIVRD